jgi:hypothetical protein
VGETSTPGKEKDFLEDSKRSDFRGSCGGAVQVVKSEKQSADAILDATLTSQAYKSSTNPYPIACESARFQPLSLSSEETGFKVCFFQILNLYRLRCGSRGANVRVPGCSAAGCI